MSKSFTPGTFCWVELGTTDANAARGFYTELFGWSASDVDMGEMGTYTLLQMNGKDIAGAYSLNDDQKQRGVPPHWLSYVKVESADASSDKAKDLGGTVIVAPFDVPNVGRMSVVQDPAGAVFALFQAGEHPGATPMDNRPGMFCWNELMTTDSARAVTFYTKLFGWSAEDQDMGPMGTYTTFKNGDRMAAGMMKISAAMGPIPPNWLVYFAVDDCDAAVANARTAGADVRVPPTQIPPIGRFATMSDPQGAVFSVIQLDNPEAN